MWRVPTLTPDTQSWPRDARPRRIVGNVVTALVLSAGVVGFAFFGFLAWFGMCGISGCSGGGFGRSTDPQGTQLKLLLAAACLLVALLVRAVVQRSPRSAAFAVGITLIGTLALGAGIGANWRGCPRSISYETCQAESR